jgi:hypothetical protein
MDFDKLLGELSGQSRSEQLIAALVETAQTMGRYFMELQAQGFTRAEALHMTVAFQTAFMQAHRPQHGPD